MTTFAYLLKKFPRLSETFVLNEILGQEGLGLPLHVFSRREPDDEPRHPQLERLASQVEVLPSRREINPWDILFSEERDPEALFARVGRVVRESKGWNHPRFGSLFAEALHLWRRTEALGIRHVHTHFATDSAIVAMLVKDLGGPSYSITAHAKDIYRNTVDPALLDRMFTNASFVVTVCDANVEYLADRLDGKAIGRVRRLYNGIDLAAFAPRYEGRDEGHVLAVGRLVEKKGFDVLLDAAALLRGRGVDFHVSILGDGDQAEFLRARVRELELDSVVELLGPRDVGEVRELMTRATVLCQPCLIGEDGNRDALPTVLLEALASGLPTISTPVTGIPEILDEGRVGVLVPERDATATADALQRLLGDPAERERLARAGRAHAEKHFDSHGVAADLHGWLRAAAEEA